MGTWFISNFFDSNIILVNNIKLIVIREISDDRLAIEKSLKYTKDGVLNI